MGLHSRSGWASAGSAAVSTTGAWTAALPAAAAPSKSSKQRNWISAIVLVALIGGLAVFAYIQSRSDVVNAEAGDCIHVESSTDFEVVDCATPEAQYKVLSVVDGVRSGALCDLDPDYNSAIEISGAATVMSANVLLGARMSPSQARHGRYLSNVHTRERAVHILDFGKRAGATHGPRWRNERSSCGQGAVVRRALHCCRRTGLRV